MWVVKYMSGNNLLEGRFGPVTQSADAVKTLLAFVGRASDPMPIDVTLDNGRMVLVLNNKKDAYYTVTSAKCSCPSAAYRPGQPCKHQRKYFPQAEATKPVSANDSIKPVAKWPGGHNGPVEDDLKVVA
jgi:hypothetical protein